MRRRGQMTKSDWHEVEVDVTIGTSDVIEFIEDYATKEDLRDIRDSLSLESPIPNTTIVDGMKLELFKKAAEKYTLEQLEGMLNLEYI